MVVSSRVVRKVVWTVDSGCVDVRVRVRVRVRERARGVRSRSGCRARCRTKPGMDDVGAQGRAGAGRSHGVGARTADDEAGERFSPHGSARGRRHLSCPSAHPAPAHQRK